MNAIALECARLGLFDGLCEPLRRDSQNGPVGILGDALVLCAWCARVAICRMAGGTLAEYQGMLPEEVVNFVTLRYHMYPYLQTAVVLYWRRGLYLSTITERTAHEGDKCLDFNLPRLT